MGGDDEPVRCALIWLSSRGRHLLFPLPPYAAPHHRRCMPSRDATAAAPPTAGCRRDRRSSASRSGVAEQAATRCADTLSPTRARKLVALRRSTVVHDGTRKCALVAAANIAPGAAPPLAWVVQDGRVPDDPAPSRKISDKAVDHSGRNLFAHLIAVAVFRCALGWRSVYHRSSWTRRTYCADGAVRALRLRGSINSRHVLPAPYGGRPANSPRADRRLGCAAAPGGWSGSADFDVSAAYAHVARAR